eukprot:COSAG02_NODE_185_length_30442_cov_59.370168_4_plen_82_part_00
MWQCREGSATAQFADFSFVVVLAARILSASLEPLPQVTKRLMLPQSFWTFRRISVTLVNALEARAGKFYPCRDFVTVVRVR